jgi:hypothetical protein
MAEQISKTKSNSNDKAEQLQNLFFSKECIASLNKILLQQNNLNNLNRDGKQDVINILIKNMKMIYRSLDSSKLNNTNFESIFKQFKEHSVKQSLSEIKQSNLIPSLQSTADLKFQRDFNSNPTQGNKFMDRPEASKNTSPLSLNQKVANVEHKRMNNQFSSFSPNSNSYESNLDQAFKPIVDDINSNNMFNAYSSGRSGDVNSKMDEIQQMRQTEVNQKNQRPSTPDFLKSIKSNPNKSENSKNFNSTSMGRPKETNVIPTTGGKPDFKNMDSSHFNQTFQGLSNDISGDLYNLENIDKPLIDAEIIEDQSNFEDRLKKLQSERSGLKPTTQQKNVDFTSDNFPKSEVGTNNVLKQDSRNIENKRNELIRQAEENKRNELIRQSEENKRNELIRQAEENKRNELIRQAEENKRHAEESKRNNIPDTSLNRFSNLKNSMKSMNIEIKDETHQLKALIDKLTIENTELKDVITKQNEQLEKIAEIKKQIAEEFESLRIKNDDIETKSSMFSLKEIELSKKESDVKQLIENYDYLFRTNQIQIEVSNNDNKSSYTWLMDMLSNVTGIKLMSYSLPEPKFNIEEDKNNLLHIKVNDDDIKIYLPTGKYDIDDLIYVLNEEIVKQNQNIEISLNKQHKVVIKSVIESDIIDIISTQLSHYNLGFTNKCNPSSNHIANKIWDLRIDDKVYLYLNNLSEKVPFGLLYFNGKSVSQFKFQSSFNLDHLDILFKDSRGNQYNFYDLPHNLSFIIEKTD